MTLRSVTFRSYTFILLYSIVGNFVYAQNPESTKPENDPLELKARVTTVVGTGIDYLFRAEGWIKHKPSYLDLKSRIEKNDGRVLIKHRIQFMPLEFDFIDFGLAYRYKQIDSFPGVDAVGVAIRLRGNNWRIPARYYPEIHLLHTKPSMKYGKIRSDCQILYYHEIDKWSLRPGIDWKFTKNLSVGSEARLYSEPEKNYVGIRLQWMGKIKY